MNKFILLLILILVALTPSGYILSYKPLQKEKIIEIISSENREFYSLTDGWQKSYDKKTWSEASVPSTEITKDLVVYKRDIKISKNFIAEKNLHFFFPGLSGQVEFYFNDEFCYKYDGAFTTYISINTKNLLPAIMN